MTPSSLAVLLIIRLRSRLPQTYSPLPPEAAAIAYSDRVRGIRAFRRRSDPSTALLLPSLFKQVTASRTTIFVASAFFGQIAAHIYLFVPLSMYKPAAEQISCMNAAIFNFLYFCEEITIHAVICANRRKESSLLRSPVSNFSVPNSRFSIRASPFFRLGLLVRISSFRSLSVPAFPEPALRFRLSNALLRAPDLPHPPHLSRRPLFPFPLKKTLAIFFLILLY